MDVFLLSRLLRELIIDNERVPVPGLGYLMTEPSPAIFSEDGLAILPPGRKISFKAEKMASGEMIWKYYAAESGIDEDTAKMELEAFMTQLIPMLKTKRVIDLQGIGRFRCTADGNVYFAAAEADNVFNSAFGFEPVTLRPINKFDTLIDTSEVAPVEEDVEFVEEVAVEAPSVQSPIRNKKTWKVLLAVLLIILAIALVGYFLLNGNYFDTLLYTEEELELINSLSK